MGNIKSCCGLSGSFSTQSGPKFTSGEVGVHSLPLVNSTTNRSLKFKSNTVQSISSPDKPSTVSGCHGNLQHISEREPDEWIAEDPSLHPTTETLFMEKSKRRPSGRRMTQSKSMGASLAFAGCSSPILLCGKSNSCSTILMDDSTVSQPNLKNTIKCVSLAIYYHIRNRDLKSTAMDMSSSSHRPSLSIFDERLHPFSKEPISSEYLRRNTEHRYIYKFIQYLFNTARLTAEVAIISLVYLERLLMYAEAEISPGSWKRITLSSILLASKVWDDQAVWNIDYCKVLNDVAVDDVNEMEKRFLELLQFNISVSSSVYAKYYFDLRTLADANNLSLPFKPLSKERAAKLEAMSSCSVGEYSNQNILSPLSHTKQWSSLDKLTLSSSRSIAILS